MTSVNIALLFFLPNAPKNDEISATYRKKIYEGINKNAR